MNALSRMSDEDFDRISNLRRILALRRRERLFGKTIGWTLFGLAALIIAIKFL